MKRLFAMLALVALPAPLAAQSVERSEPDPQGMQRLLEERSREALHPNPAPTTVVGIGQSDNDFREATPLLSQSDKALSLVDREEAYRRRIDLYTRGAVFHAPLASTGRVRATATGWEPAPAVDGDRFRGVGVQQPGESGGWQRAILQAVALLALVVLILRKYYLGHPG